MVLAVPAWASAGKGVEIGFDVSARDTHLGSGKLIIGPKGSDGEAGKGAKGRAVRLLGKTESLLGVLYAGRLDATSWLDGAWLPAEAHWQSELAGKKAHTIARFAGKRVQATFARPGAAAVQVDQTVAATLLDPVALVPWLMAQKPKPGKTLATYLYTGMDVCQVDLHTGPVEAVAVHGQTRDALPLSGETKNCRISRKFTIWLAARDYVPVKMALHDALLGSIDFVLSGVRSVEVAGERPPSVQEQGPPAP